MKNFVGRKSEFEVLSRTAAEAVKGEAGSVFIYGRNGTGKSRLLRHVFEHLFSHCNEIVPFLYTFRTAFISVETLTRDYITCFILQYLAFMKKDRTMIDTCVYSMEELARLAGDSGMEWVVRITDECKKILSNNDPQNLFLFAISLPQRSFQETGIPVLVMLDDFNKIRKFSDLNSDRAGRDFWTLYEKAIQSPATPHIFTGLDAEINEMFFEETVFGESLEIMDLKGLSGEESSVLFHSLCEAYGLNVEADVNDLVDVFAGNPFYMKNILQAARHRGCDLSESEFRQVYAHEVTEGKTCKYWTSLLKKYVTQFDLRKTALIFLYSLCVNAEKLFEDPEEQLSIGRDKLDGILKLLNLSGVVESGFSEIRLADDVVMQDVIKGLYYREIAREPIDKVKEKILSGKGRQKESAESDSFDINLPDLPNAGNVAVKSLEHIAGQFNIAPETTGQLQLALIELFSGIHNGTADEGCRLSFSRQEDNFLIGITMNRKSPRLAEDDLERIRLYIDEVKTEYGTITLVKDVARAEERKS